MAAEARLSDAGLETTGVDDTICCFAVKTETWVNDPDGAPWEWYVKTGDADQMTNQVIGEAETTCAAPAAPAPATLGQEPASAESLAAAESRRDYRRPHRQRQQSAIRYRRPGHPGGGSPANGTAPSSGWWWRAG